MELDWFEVGERISGQRNKLGLKQQDIYDKMSISQNHYSRVENGHVGISVEKLIQLSDILNISIDYILTGKHQGVIKPILRKSTANLLISKRNILTSKLTASKNLI